MANFIENLGLEEILESEETLNGFLGYILENGKAIVGYSGNPNIYMPMGMADFFVRTIIDKDAESIDVVGLDTHVAGRNIWKMSISIDITPEDADAHEKRLVMSRDTDGRGMAVVNVLNADVLPSFLEDDVCELQMCAFADSIDYFADESEYEKAQPSTPTGQKYMLSDGSIFPSGFMLNHDPDRSEDEKDYSLDDRVLIRGTVKTLFRGTVKIGEDSVDSFLRCLIDTEFGELELIHTLDLVDKSQYDNIKEGATVAGVFVLSGDAAIYKYSDGFVLDEEHDLMALRYSICQKNAERPRTIFAKDSVYISETNGTEINGIDGIIAKIKEVMDSKSNDYSAYMATITSTDSDSLKYSAQKRCVILANGEDGDYESIAFIETDEKGRIAKLTVTDNPGYYFEIDRAPETEFTDFDEFRTPESYSEAMITRAKVTGFLDDESNINQYLDLDNTPEHMFFLQKAKALDVAIGLFSRKNPEGDVEQFIKNLFGYYFAKAVELGFSRDISGNFTAFHFIHFALVEAEKDEPVFGIRRDLIPKLEYAYNKGKIFYKDFSLFYEFDIDNEDYKKELINAFVTVQKIGLKCVNRDFMKSYFGLSFSGTQSDSVKTEYPIPESLQILHYCFNSNNFNCLCRCLSENCTYTSHWVMEEMVGARVIENYLKAKSDAIEKSQAYVQAEYAEIHSGSCKGFALAMFQNDFSSPSCLIITKQNNLREIESIEICMPELFDYTILS